MPSGRTTAAALRSNQAGYAMVALLVTLNIMAVMLTVAMPVWRQMVQREREIELVFRGEQYRRALQLYERRNGPGMLPPDLDTLVEGRFLRKVFKDPITGGDFVLIRASAGQSGFPESAAGPGQIVGVVSSSSARSIRIYEGQTAYNQWLFVYSGGESPANGNGQVGDDDGPGAGRGGRLTPAGVGRGRGFNGRGRGNAPNTAGRGANPGAGRGVAP